MIKNRCLNISHTQNKIVALKMSHTGQNSSLKSHRTVRNEKKSVLSGKSGKLPFVMSQRALCWNDKEV